MEENRKPAALAMSDSIASFVSNKRARSLMFLIITFAMILLANGLLPLLSGQAHYTADVKSVTYGEYLFQKENNELFDLTYGAKFNIGMYKQMYLLANPDLTPEEVMLIEPPLDMKVNIYTKFFFESPWWYVDTTISLISAVFLFYALFNYYITRDKDERIEHVNAEHTLAQLNEKYLDPDTFEPWMEEEFNVRRKIKQHIRNTKYKLKKLEQRTPYRIRRRFKNYFDNMVPVPANNLLPVPYMPLTEAELDYLDKKEEILDQLGEDYIKHYVVDTKVKYFKDVQPGFIYSGVNVEGVTQDTYSALQTDAQKIRGSIFAKLVITFAVTVAFASILTVLAVGITEQDPLWVVVTIIFKIVPLILQVYFAINYTNEFMEKHLLPNLKARENIALMYLAEMRRRGVVTGEVEITKITLEGDGRYAKNDRR